MTRKKIKNENTTTLDTVGYQRPVLTSKKDSKKDVPWYMKSVQEVYALVREEIAQVKLLSEAGSMSNNPEDMIRSIEGEMARLQRAKAQGQGDDQTDRRLAQFQNQIQSIRKATETGGRDWRDYMINPKKTKEREDRRKDLERGRKKADPHGRYKALAMDIIKKYESPSHAWPEGKHQAAIVALKNLKKYVGAIPSNQKEYEKIDSWIQNRLIKVHNGDLDSYLATQKSNVPFDTKSKGLKSPTMKTKGPGKYSAPLPKDARFPKTSEPKVPGYKSSLSDLQKALEKDPEHAKDPFIPPKGSGKGFDPGSGGEALKRAYDKIIRGVVDPSELGDVDPEAFKVKKGEMTNFEKALGPYLRKLYGKAGYKMVEPEYKSGASTATKGMKLMLSKVLGVPFNDVDDAIDKAKENPAKWKEVEEKALARLEKMLPGDFRKEMEMRNRRDAASDEMKPKPTPPPAQAKKPKKDQEPPENYHSIMKAFDRIAKRRKGPTKKDSTKSQRREYTRSFDEPRDPEATERRKKMEPEFARSGAQHKRDEQKRKNLELIKQRYKAALQKKGMGEALEDKAEKKNWSDAKPPARKDWTKSLSLGEAFRRVSSSKKNK